VIYPRIKTFTDEFHEGKPAGYEGGADSQKPSKSKNDVNVSQGGSRAAAVASSNKTTTPEATKAASSLGTSAGQKITIKETFYASAHHLVYIDEM
jgi:hypothetical protein